MFSVVSTLHDNYEYNLQHSKYCSRRGEKILCAVTVVRLDYLQCGEKRLHVLCLQRSLEANIIFCQLHF